MPVIGTGRRLLLVDPGITASSGRRGACRSPSPGRLFYIWGNRGPEGREHCSANIYREPLCTLAIEAQANQPWVLPHGVSLLLGETGIKHQGTQWFIAPVMNVTRSSCWSPQLSLVADAGLGARHLWHRDINPLTEAASKAT